MAHVGSISNFDESIEDFDSYCSRINFYLIANSVKEDKKKAVFVTLLGPKVFSLLQNLVVSILIITAQEYIFISLQIQLRRIKRKQSLSPF